MRPRLNVWEVVRLLAVSVGPPLASMRPRLNVWEVVNSISENIFRYFASMRPRLNVWEVDAIPADTVRFGWLQ